MNLPRITNIIEVRPDFSVVCNWNTGEIRIIPFKEKLSEWAQHPNDVCNQLSDFNRFKQVKTDGYTLLWENGMKIKYPDGHEEPCPLDFCPDVLYDLSKPIN